MTLTDGVVANGGPDFEVELVPHARALAPMRHEVAERLALRNMAPAAIDDLLLILSELCTNAIQATAPGAGPVQVRVRLGPAAVTIEVDNAGSPFDEDLTAAQRRVSSDTERGRGLVVVRALADEVTLRHHGDRCVVQVVMRLG